MTVGQAETKTLTARQALSEALDIALATDPRVFLLGEDLADPAGGVSGMRRARGCDDNLRRHSFGGRHPTALRT